MTDWRGAWRRLGRPAPLRPPGAREEEAFAGLCIRCGRCVEVCPYAAVRPAGWSYGLAAGTPLIVPQQEPCYLCMLCPPVCPTGALVPVATPRAVRIGRAVVDREQCWAHQGILCRTCVDECPLQGEAILQDGQLRPMVTEACVGCGICERFCPGKGPSIRVVARGEEA